MHYSHHRTGGTLDFFRPIFFLYSQVNENVHCAFDSNLQSFNLFGMSLMSAAMDAFSVYTSNQGDIRHASWGLLFSRQNVLVIAKGLLAERGVNFK